MQNKLMDSRKESQKLRHTLMKLEETPKTEPETVKLKPNWQLLEREEKSISITSRVPTDQDLMKLHPMMKLTKFLKTLNRTWELFQDLSTTSLMISSTTTTSMVLLLRKILIDSETLCKRILISFLVTPLNMPKRQRLLSIERKLIDREKSITTSRP